MKKGTKLHFLLAERMETIKSISVSEVQTESKYYDRKVIENWLNLKLIELWL